MSGFMDIHSHFGYGMDDGAQTRQDMENMLDAAFVDGVAFLFATPHVTPGLEPFDRDKFLRHLDEARMYCKVKGYRISLLSGAEVLYTQALDDYIRDHRLPTLYHSDYVLTEFVPDVSYEELEHAAAVLSHAGYAPILAHVERYDCLFHGKNLQKLKAAYDIRCQMNANTLLKGRGLLKDRRIWKWVKEDLIDFVASDAHDVRRRPPRMREAYRALQERVGDAYAKRLTGLE